MFHSVSGGIIHEHGWIRVGSPLCRRTASQSELLEVLRMTMEELKQKAESWKEPGPIDQIVERAGEALEGLLTDNLKPRSESDRESWRSSSCSEKRPATIDGWFRGEEHGSTKTTGENSGGKRLGRTVGQRNTGEWQGKDHSQGVD